MKVHVAVPVCDNCGHQHEGMIRSTTEKRFDDGAYTLITFQNYCEPGEFCGDDCYPRGPSDA